jgi:ubiquitin carboxyl-terminal hydrolase 14
MATMSSITVEVKWQKEVFKGVEIDLQQPPTVFKMQLFSLTGVPPERQKIMGFKGGLLKDDADWEKTGARDGQKVTMMGTAERAPEAPPQAQTFVEDLPEEEQDTTGLGKYGAGLENLGNTCYMNSTVQCLYAVPELRSSLASLPTAGTGAVAADSLAVAAGNLFSRMERSATAVTPLEFIVALRRAYPQFDQRTREGVPMQQDAEECWNALMTALRTRLTGPDGQAEVQRLFGVRTKATLRCDETEETMDIEEVEPSLKCNITGEVNHLAEGLHLGLRGDREKTSPALGHLVKFTGEASIEALPPYLTVQMMRFFYKADVQQKAKILRKVTFPLVLDMYEFCSEALKTALEGPRLAAKEAEDAKAGLVAKRQKIEGSSNDNGTVDATTTKNNAAANNGNVGDVVMADTGDGGVGTTAEPPQRSQLAGALTGRYELIGVLTHKGRSLDSGHYVSWVKQPDGQWVQFDDDNMILRKEEEVLTLSGGGDWHMAYMLLYKAIRVPEMEAENAA